MEETQSFRLIGREEIVKISVSNVGGQNVVYWDDIQEVFPGVQHVQNGDVAVNKLKDSEGIRIVPHRIKHFPGLVLDVILTSATNHIHDESLITNPSVTFPATLSEAVSGLAITEPFADLSSAEPRQATIARESTAHIHNQLSSIMATIEQSRHSGKPLTSEALSSLIASKLTPQLTTKSGFERTVIHKLDGLFNQGATTQQLAREIIELQKQMNDRLILIQSKTEAILTQQLELTEYPIPRLFIVLPEERVKYDPGNWFRTKFRLHFICECGKHTESNNSK
ncbi:hypothetical protein EC991_005742, partial [Linnemannia zychae]